MDRYFLKREAFSLTEIAIGLGVISVMLLTFYPLAMQVLSKSRYVQSSSDLQSVAQACQQYYQQFGFWPAQAKDLQPYFISPSANLQKFVLSSNPNTLSVSLAGLSLTVVRPRGITSRLDYQKLQI